MSHEEAAEENSLRRVHIALGFHKIVFAGLWLKPVMSDRAPQPNNLGHQLLCEEIGHCILRHGMVPWVA